MARRGQAMAKKLSHDGSVAPANVTGQGDKRITDGVLKLQAFTEAHPELREAMGLWLADRDTFRIVYPEAGEIFERELAEL
jgi:hypothetical protein